MSPQIYLNGEPVDTSAPVTLTQFIDQCDHQWSPPFSVAINGEFVPRSQYDETPVNPGDAVDIVSPVGGG